MVSLGCAFLLGLYGGLSAGVELCGVIESDLNLKAENSPYLITGALLIKRGVFMNVEPGVAIQVAAEPACTDSVTARRDSLNRSFIAIEVRGAFQCVGSSKSRISIGPAADPKGRPRWYGIVLDGANSEYSRISYTDISGALYGVSVRASDPVIRNCVFTGNQTAVLCEAGSKPSLYNNNIIDNSGAGLLVRGAFPEVMGNLFMGNLMGLWSDKKSKIKVEYNNFWNNPDGDFLDAPPELGLLTRQNKRGDRCDARFNLFTDPVFYGSKAHADSVDKDLKVPTDTAKADVADRKLSRVIVQSLPDSARKADALNAPHAPWQLSRYSRLIDGGPTSSKFKDADGTRNDIGVHGGAEFK